MANNAILLKPSMVFPTTKLDSVNKLVTEGNLTKLINNLLDIDSYIIPLDDNSFNLSNTIWNDTLGTLVKIENLSGDKTLECMLHGYYFNLGTIVSLAGQFGNLDNKKLVARIIVDSTDVNFPELFGQGVEISDSIEITAETNIIPGVTKLDKNFRNKDIYTISAKALDNATYYFTLDSEYTLNLELQPGQTTPSFLDTYYIQYVTYYNLVSLYITDFDGTIPDVSTLNVVLPNEGNYQEYTLDILCKLNGEYYLILNTFPKFVSASISNIDGGVI